MLSARAGPSARGEGGLRTGGWVASLGSGPGAGYTAPPAAARLGLGGGCRMCDGSGVRSIGGRLGPCAPRGRTCLPGRGAAVALEVQGGCAPTLLVPLPSQPPRGLYITPPPPASRPRGGRPPGSEPATPPLTSVGDFYVWFLFSILYRGILFPSLRTEVTFLVLLLTCSFF